MMKNATHVSHLTLAAYFDTGPLKPLCFLVVLCVYVLIIVCNVLLMAVICVNRSLHEPMYVFLCSLFVNELYGSIGLFPSLLLHILSHVHTVSVSLCLLQVFSLHSYGQMELFNLAVMSYDRYLAICFPLQYHTRMSRRRVVTLIAAEWVYGFFLRTVMVCVTASLQLCGNIISKVYCDNFSVVKLSCSDIRAYNIYAFTDIVLSIFCPFLLIFYSYMRILKVCFSGCKQTRHKAVTTCTPQLASLLSYTLGASFELIQGRFNMNNVPNMLRIFLSLYFLMIQPLFNPLMYGLNISQIRILCKKMLFAKT